MADFSATITDLGDKLASLTLKDAVDLGNYLKDLYQRPAIGETCNLDHIKRHYYRSHPKVNPTQIVPKGPILDWDSPHDRDRF